ncbi:MAG: GTP-binding protein [Noviherbaspirillum sp.]|nr:GTP-binding protein [Noviherbaspirillum sp.]
MPNETKSLVRKTPVILLTGFLGSGKTTLLREVLTRDGWRDTAVLVNELGAVGLDQSLLHRAGGSTVVLENGCVCCSIGDDLLTSLEDLFWQRLQRRIPSFSRVVIETTGLADPGPIVDALLSSGLVSERYSLASVWCTVDTTAGDAQFERHPECLAQAACADLIILTKTDLAEENGIDALQSRLRAINPLAQFERAAKGMVPFATLEQATQGEQVRLLPSVLPNAPASGIPKQAAAEPADGAQPFPQYHARVNTLVMKFIRPWPADSLRNAIEATLSRYGENMLRMKGLVSVEGEAAPLVVQAVRSRLFPFEALKSLPEAAPESFLVCISLGLPPEKIMQEFRSHLDESDPNFPRKSLLKPLGMNRGGRKPESGE